MVLLKNVILSPYFYSLLPQPYLLNQQKKKAEESISGGRVNIYSTGLVLSVLDYCLWLIPSIHGYTSKTEDFKISNNSNMGGLMESYYDLQCQFSRKSFERPKFRKSCCERNTRGYN